VKKHKGVFLLSSEEEKGFVIAQRQVILTENWLLHTLKVNKYYYL
jgi:hypothetical protein